MRYDEKKLDELVDWIKRNYRESAWTMVYVLPRLEACRLPDVPPEVDAVEVLAKRLRLECWGKEPPCQPFPWNEINEETRNEYRREARYVLSHYGRGETVFDKWESGDYRNVASNGDLLMAYKCSECQKAFYQRKVGFGKPERIAKDWPPPTFCPHCGAKAVEEKRTRKPWARGSIYDPGTERRKGGEEISRDVVHIGRWIADGITEQSGVWGSGGRGIEARISFLGFGITTATTNAPAKTVASIIRGVGWKERR